MNEGDFTLNKPGFYVPQSVAENDFINEKMNDSDKSKYGLTYSVKFEENAETFLWTAKNEPEVGKKYWGHLQSTSGKSIRFKVDKQEDAPQTAQTGSTGSTQSTDESIARAVALRHATVLLTNQTIEAQIVLELANDFLAWLQGKEIEIIEELEKAEPDPQWADVPTPPPEDDDYEDRKAVAERKADAKQTRDWNSVGKHDN